MIYFCKTAKRISIGIIVSVKTANTCCHSLEYRPKKLYTAKGIVHFGMIPEKQGNHKIIPYVDSAYYDIGECHRF